MAKIPDYIPTGSDGAPASIDQLAALHIAQSLMDGILASAERDYVSRQCKLTDGMFGKQVMIYFNAVGKDADRDRDFIRERYGAMGAALQKILGEDAAKMTKALDNDEAWFDIPVDTLLEGYKQNVLGPAGLGEHVARLQGQKPSEHEQGMVN
jgi:hypothetical protein